ncbi:MAG TPA: YhdP family protein [Thiobacillaceae bacterium]|nr:YhdP family protein [Thiobacillaceae bacterium]HNU65033.1 YhdP family protein [Thiobacillaceae bacterium]
MTLLLRRLVHYAFHLVVGAVILMCGVALVLKFWFMPNVDHYRPILERAASQAVGVPVRIGTLRADWQGIHPRLVLGNVRLTPASGEALVLPRVEAVASWWSLYVLDLRLRRLSVEDARVPLRRAADGIIYLAGIPINGAGAPSPFPDWLLRQPRLIIKDARVRWLDEKLAAPTLQFSDVRLLLENRFGRHRFGGMALPSDAARQLDLRGDFRGDSIHDFRSWSGTLFAQVGGARFTSWGQWVPWARSSVKGGVGDMRFWVDLKHGKVRGVTGDARLTGVSVSLSPGLPPLSFESLAGHIGWERGDSKSPSHTFYVERLRFKAPHAEPAEPASLRLTLVPDGRGGYRRVDVVAGNLRLEAFTALSSALPLPKRGQGLIEALAPRGLVESASGHWAGKNDYSLRLRLRRAGAQAYADFPGIAGLDLRLEADQDGGKAQVSGQGFLLDWPHVFRHAIALNRLDANANWRRTDDGLALNFQAEQLANADLEGTARGHVQIPAQGSPRVDIRAHLSRGEAVAVHRYLPRQVPEGTYDWLKRSLLAGRSDDVRLTLRGDLRDYPFDQGKGEFSVSVNMLDGVLDYAAGWPRIEGIRGSLRFHDKAMTLLAHTGRILNAQLGPVKVVIPDLYYTPEEILEVEGRATGETHTFLEFIRRSPLDRYTHHFTQPFAAQGSGALSVKLRLPLRRIDAGTLAGTYTFRENSVRVGEGLPDLGKVNGSLSFTQQTVQGQNLRLRVLDMPAVLDLRSQRGAGVHVRLRGSASAANLRPHLPALLAGRLTGSTSWQAELDLDGGQASGLEVSSDLMGLALDLPPPLGKGAAQSVALNVNHRTDADGTEVVTARYGGLARMHARFPRNSQGRVNIQLGGDAPAEPTEAGLWIAGTQRALDLDAWRALDWDTGMAGAGPDALPFRQASVRFNELLLLNRRWHDTQLRLQPAGKGWNLQVAGREATGELVTVPDPKGLRLIAKFKRLNLPEPEGRRPTPALDSTGPSTRLRHMDLHIQSLAWKQRELGELRLRLSPVKAGYQLENFLLTPAEGRLEGSGQLSDHPMRPSRLKLKLSSPNLGRLLTRLGYEDALKGGGTEVSGSLGWMGGAEDFDLRTLAGNLDLSIRQGQFLKVDPGAGRLIGVLSLQSLPRRINLDFRDVFSQGFAFDEIKGQMHIERGSAYTRDLRMNGPAAKVSMSGIVNLPAETQNLLVHIQPRLEDTVAVAGALVGGPVVGLGTLLASKVLKDPIGQATGFDYEVTGTWADPVIRKLARKQSSVDGEDAFRTP